MKLLFPKISLFGHYKIQKERHKHKPNNDDCHEGSEKDLVTEPLYIFKRSSTLMQTTLCLLTENWENAPSRARSKGSHVHDGRHFLNLRNWAWDVQISCQQSVLQERLGEFVGNIYSESAQKGHCVLTENWENAPPRVRSKS